MSFSQYVAAVSRLISSQDGPKLRDIMALDNANAMQAIFEAQQRNARWDPSSTCRDKLVEPWDEVLAAHCLCLGCLLKGNRAEAYTHLETRVTAFLKAFRDDKDAWLIEPMLAAAHDLRTIATAADDELRKAGKKPVKREDAGQLLQKCFSSARQGHGNKVKRVASLEIVNTLFKIYFSLNTLRLCKTLINSMDQQFPSLDSFPLPQRVTYRFYVGRLAVFDENFERARDELTFAFANCDPAVPKNRALILKYLIPVQMVLGVLPKPALLQKYGMEIFSDIAEAMKTGNIQLFNECMARNQETFIQQGTFLLLEKLNHAIYRMLFRRVAAIHREMEPAKASQIPLGLFQAALAWQNADMDLDEVECILANLIYRKYIKGYMSHQHRVIVISKADPFPLLTKIIFVDIN